MFFETMILKEMNIRPVRVVCFLSCAPVHETIPVFLNVSNCLIVFHWGLTTKNCFEFAFASVNSDHFGEVVGSIRKSTTKEKSGGVLTVFGVNKIYDFSDVTISTWTYK